MVGLRPYDATTRRLVLAGKNGSRRDVLRVLGHRLGLAPVLQTGSFDVITWVPASRSAARRRGYDQGRLLATAVGGCLGVPVRRLLARDDWSAQAGLSRTDRLIGPSLRPTAPRSVDGRRVLVVDDVVTTGTSLAAVATVLRRVGATSVVAAAVAIVAGDSRWAGVRAEFAKSDSQVSLIDPAEVCRASHGRNNYQ